jgi:hypothetical protein
MAQIPLVSGGSQPVFAIDTLNGPQLAANVAYTPAGTPVMIMGPKLDFFGVGNCPSSISNQAEVNGAIQQILQQIQLTSTVAFYQAGNTQISLAVYPTGAYTAATLQAAIRGLGNIQVSAAGTVTGYNVSTVNVTNVGFDLSATAT